LPRIDPAAIAKRHVNLTPTVFRRGKGRTAISGPYRRLLGLVAGSQRAHGSMTDGGRDWTALQ
jgi:hypothetical protein